MPSKANNGLKIDKRYIIIALFFVIAMYVILPQLNEFKSSWHLLLKPNKLWLSLALILSGATYLAGSMTYVLLAFKRLQYLQVLLVQLAAMFINRLLPAGVGALGANFLFLRHNKHSNVQAGSVVAINNLLGFLGHGLILGAVIILSPKSVDLDNITDKFGGIAVIVVFAVLAVAIVAGLVLGGRRLKIVLSDIGRQLASYRARPMNLVGALGSSAILTIANVLCLMACAQAVGIHLAFVPVMLVFSFGVGLGAATPTPGGLGGFEAGLVAGFVAYGVDSSTALAAALLFRIVSYWLPLLIGMIAFVICQQRGLFMPSK